MSDICPRTNCCVLSDESLIEDGRRSIMFDMVGSAGVSFPFGLTVRLFVPCFVLILICAYASLLQLYYLFSLTYTSTVHRSPIWTDHPNSDESRLRSPQRYHVQLQHHHTLHAPLDLGPWHLAPRRLTGYSHLRPVSWAQKRRLATYHFY